MTAIKSTSSVYGVTYSIVDAAGNELTIANGMPLVVGNDPERLTSTPTAEWIFNGTYIRITQAQATNYDPPAAATAVMDADGELVRFVQGVAQYAGGQFEGANTGGVRMFAKGLFLDLTAGNLTDIGTVMTSFASAGVVS